MSPPLSPVSPGISGREFARREGCDPALVRRAVAQGKLQALPDGTLSPALVGTGWRHGNRHAGGGGDTPGDTLSPPVPTPAPVSPPARLVLEHDPQPHGGALKRVRKADDDACEDIDFEDFEARFLAGEAPKLATSERVKAAAQALKYTLAARRAAGALVEIEVAQQVLFENARAARDAWLNWPSRVGPLIAAALGVEADLVLQALTPHVHQQLADLGEPEADFTSPDDEPG